MSDMTPYFQSLARAADVACAVSETLQAHPYAVVKYRDEEVNQELIEALGDLENAVEDPENHIFDNGRFEMDYSLESSESTEPAQQSLHHH